MAACNPPFDPRSLDRHDRRTSFELHILPMFRLVDRDHMNYFVDETQVVDLTDYETVRKYACTILRRLQLNMPPVYSGGLWPREWILLFARWIDEDYPRLLPASGTYSAARRDDGLIELRVAGAMAATGEQAWLERFTDSESPRVYALLREPGSRALSPERPIVEIFPAVAGVDHVLIRDAAGEQRVDF